MGKIAAWFFISPSKDIEINEYSCHAISSFIHLSSYKNKSSGNYNSSYKNIPLCDTYLHSRPKHHKDLVIMVGYFRGNHMGGPFLKKIILIELLHKNL